MPSSIKAKVMRLTRTDGCGNAIGGPTGSVITDGFIKVDSKADIEAGTEFYTKNAWGDPCINDIDCTRLKRYDLTYSLCDISPSATELMCGYRLITDAATPANAIGNAIDEVPGSCGTGFICELWTKIAGAGCGGPGTYAWIHWLFPMVRYGMLTDFSFENAAMQQTLVASTIGNPNFQSGPYDQWVAVGGSEHLLYQFTNTAPPTASDEAYTAVTLPAAGAVPVAA